MRKMTDGEWFSCVIGSAFAAALLIAAVQQGCILAGNDQVGTQRQATASAPAGEATVEQDQAVFLAKIDELQAKIEARVTVNYAADAAVLGVALAANVLIVWLVSRRGRRYADEVGYRKQREKRLAGIKELQRIKEANERARQAAGPLPDYAKCPKCKHEFRLLRGEASKREV